MTASQPTTNAAAFAAAQAVIPGGVDSPVRAFGSVGGTPRFMAGARGPYLTDVEGNEYVDLVCSWGPMLLGHQHPEVVEAVHAAVDRGLGFGTSTLEETALAELIAGLAPDVTLLLLPPMLEGDAGLAGLPLAHTLLMVADGTTTVAGDLKSCDRLNEDGPPILGVVMVEAEV